MSTPSQPHDRLDRQQAELHAARILQLAEAQDTPGLMAYLNDHLPRTKWDAMVFIYSTSRDLQATVFRGQITITGFRQSPVQASVSGLTNLLLY